MTTTQLATTTEHAYTIDKAHSEVTFQVRHLLTKVRGRFSDFAGTIRVDDGAPENSSVSLKIDAASVDTNNTDRDQHLRSDDFFAVGTYPTITFDGSRIVKKTADTFDVTGALTIPRRRTGGHAAGHVSRNGKGSLGQRPGGIRNRAHD